MPATLLVMLLPHRSLADEKQACAGAYRAAQIARRDGHLLHARDQLLICARRECPAAVTNDCVPWLENVQKDLPSVVLVARTDAGRDLVNVTVTLDGKPIATNLDGKPLDIDPGVHSFRFETPGFPAIEQKVVVAASEKNRVVSIRFTGGAAASSTSPPAVTAQSVRPVPALVYVAGGIGLLGWGGLTWFGLRFDSQVNDLNRCDPSCPQSQIDDAAATRRLAFLSGAIGLIGSGAAAYFYFTRPERAGTPTSAPAISFTVAPTGAGAHGVVIGSF